MKAILIKFGFSDMLFRANIHALCKTQELVYDTKFIE